MINLYGLSADTLETVTNKMKDKIALIIDNKSKISNNDIRHLRTSTKV